MTEGVEYEDSVLKEEETYLEMFVHDLTPSKVPMIEMYYTLVLISEPAMSDLGSLQ